MALSRRTFLGSAAGAALSAGCRGTGQRENPPIDLALVNGRCVDERGEVGTSLAIRDGRIVAIGPGDPLPAATRTVDLGGRTVIPGLVDAHVHYTRAGVNPGHQERRIERALSIPELQETLARRAATAPPGEFLTCIGGWNHAQLAESRRPSIAELDDAAPDHAVYLAGTGGGTGGLTNTLGRRFFEANGVAVDPETGAVSSTNGALAALRAVQTDEDRLRGTSELNDFAASMGLTTVINSGNIEDQVYPLRLWREDRLSVRMRPTFPAASPEDAETRARYNFAQAGRAVGDDLYRPAGFAERIGGNNTMSDWFEPTAQVIARYGWMLQQHSISSEENAFHIEAFRSIARSQPIEPLRWSLLHLQEISESHLRDLVDLGAGASAQTWTYLGSGGGPPFRRILDSGIAAGVGTDSTNVSPLDPWLAIFYMTTGRNLAGELTNAGQQISRLEALKLYTRGAAWFAFDDTEIGSFEPGKYADLAVLSEDYLDVPEERLRRIESVLTLLGGRPVHGSGDFAALA